MNHTPRKTCMYCGDSLESGIAKTLGSCFRCEHKRANGTEFDDGSIRGLFYAEEDEDLDL